jgi:tetratricopeptide (TPR) repeat protein
MEWMHALQGTKLATLLVLLSAVFAVADDRADCRYSDDAGAFDACSRLIAAKRLRGQALAEVYNTRGSLSYFKRDDAASAIADHTEAIKLAPRFVQAYIDRGVVYANRNADYDNAISDYTSALRIDPKNHGAFDRRADAHKSKKEYDLAITDYGEAIRLMPKEASYYFSRGSVYYYYKEDYDRAIGDYSQAIGLNPRDATYMASRGEGYEKKGDFHRAIADFRAALAIEPDNRWAKEGLARVEPRIAPAPVATAPVATPVAVSPGDRDSCQSVAGARQAAIEACTRLIMSGTIGGDELIGAYIWRGSHLAFANAHDRAIDDYDHVLALDPRSALAYRGRGASYEYKGDLNRALADFRMALSIEPRLQDVADAVQRVQQRLQR